ncbi:MAG: MBL fold metallo-hydrolase RNA specificity domain-containing protein [Dethiobacteria bacterium]|jgi:metallo-beta-lactamase family protein
MLTLKFCGGAKTVTGSCFLLQTESIKILVDCGMFQGGRELRERNYGDFPFDPAEISALFLTHAHIDHSGLIPKLVKNGFRGNIYATCATADLCRIMLPDSGHIQEMEAEWQNRKARRAGRPETEPLYTVQEAVDALEYFVEVDYDRIMVLDFGLSFRLRNSGHILGSAIIELWVTDEGDRKKLVFTGDLGRKNQSIICDPDIIEEADYLLLEGTYGQRFHEGEEEKTDLLREIINSTLERDGNIVVPSFAVGRTQELLYILNKLIERGEIPPLPIYIDSPMAIRTTDVFIEHAECFDLEMRACMARGESPLHFPEAFFTPKVEQSRKINEIEGGALIISASGMCDAGRIKHHLKHNLWRPGSTVLFVGYQAQGSMGRYLLDGADRVTLFGEEIKVRARIASIGGFSAHADQNEILEWVGKIRDFPSQIILIHGEDEPLQHLAALLEEKYGAEVYIPSYLEEISLFPLGIPGMGIKEEISARIKSREIRDLWKENSRFFANRLSDYLEKEWDIGRLEALEERLGFLLRQMENESNYMKSSPLIFAPPQVEVLGDKLQDGDAHEDKGA